MSATPRALVAASVLATMAVMPPRRAAAQGSADSLRALPLVEVPARAPGNVVAVFLSGDGGWAGIDKDMATELANRGIAVVGLNIRSYLRQERTPDDAARDVERMLREYSRRWQRPRLAVVGFSHGADLAPFIVNRLAPDVRTRLALVALVGLATHATIKFHWADVVRDVKRPDDRPTRPEVEKMSGVATLCVYGADEAESGCVGLPAAVKAIARPGGHHMDGDYKAVADLIVDALR